MAPPDGLTLLGSIGSSQPSEQTVLLSLDVRHTGSNDASRAHERIVRRGRPDCGATSLRRCSSPTADPNIGSVQLHAWIVLGTYRPPTSKRESASRGHPTRPSGSLARPHATRRPDSITAQNDARQTRDGPEGEQPAAAGVTQTSRASGSGTPPGRPARRGRRPAALDVVVVDHVRRPDQRTERLLCLPEVPLQATEPVKVGLRHDPRAPRSRWPGWPGRRPAAWRGVPLARAGASVRPPR